MKRLLNNVLIRIRHRHWSEILKRVELKLLGKHASTKAPSMPSHVQIELNTNCNLSCNYCHLDDKEYRKAIAGELALDEVLKILPSLKGCKVLMLYGLGEPLLYTDLEVVIAEARKFVPNVCFTSNGLLLNEKRSRSLAEAGLSWIHVSLDGIDPEYHRRIRGGDVDKIINNLEVFSKLTRLPVHLWSVVTTENINHLLKLPELKSRIPTITKLQFQLVMGAHLLDKHDLDGRISEITLKDFKRKISRDCEKYDIDTNVESLSVSPPKGVCPAPWTGTTFINRQGFVTPCCILREVSMDNVVEMGLKEAWNRPKIRAFRQELLDGNYLPSCSNSCGYYCNEKNSYTELDKSHRPSHR